MFADQNGIDTIDCIAGPVAPISHTYIGTNFQDGGFRAYPDSTVTFNGGQLVDFFGYLTQDFNTSCGSGAFEPRIDLEFSQPTSRVITEVFNWLPEPMTYTMSDNLGRSTKISLPAAGFFPSGSNLVSISGSGITRIRITADAMSSDSRMRWRFSVRGVTWVPETASCQCGTTQIPGPHRVTGYNWAMDVEVSGDDGLVLRNVMLGDRYLAREISVPYYVLRTSALLATRAELKPNSTDAEARSRLIDYRETVDSEKLVITAVYSVDRIPASSESCLTFTQRYEFHKAGIGCEPSDSLPCATLKPIMEYNFRGQEGQVLHSVNIVQRDYFQVDGKAGNSVGLFRDCEDPTNGFSPCFGEVFAQRRNPLLTETVTSVLGHGLDLGIWDNFHQTYESLVQEPKFLPPAPGCPECAHMHWRWGPFAANPIFGGGPKFGDPPGHPLIPAGSEQSLDIAVSRWHPDEQDPRTYLDLILGNPEPLIQDVVFWYSATGFQNQDRFLTHGIFFNPAVRNAKTQSGPVSVTHFNLFEPGLLSVVPIEPATAGVLPDGYAVYDNLAYDVSTDAEVSGPHIVSFKVASAADPHVFTALRVLHGERDPDDPTRTVLVDRTILPPDPDAGTFDAGEISARVDSFSPFVIARVSDASPPTSTATVVPAPNADGWNNTDVTITFSATDDSGVRQITFTNALTGVNTTVLSATATSPANLEGGNEITFYATDKFGNVESPKSIFVNIDKSAPFFVFISPPAPEPNAAGWNNSDVSINYAVDDNDGSGVFPSQRTLILMGEGAAVTGTISVIDRAGNRSSQTTAAVKIDKTSPVSTHNVSLSASQATVMLSASDNLSGVAATRYSINGGALQSYTGPFTVSDAGSYLINYYSVDMADNKEPTRTANFSVGSGPTTVTLEAVKDSFLRNGADDTNEGANERLRIQSSGQNRVLLGFDLSNVTTANLVSATLVMVIAENSNNWGATGGLVDAHRLLTDWAQGNGRNDLMAGAGPGVRGTDVGVTWNCAGDVDISNHRRDCQQSWNGGSFAAATASGVLHTNGLSGEVRWDVTADVSAGAGAGWIVKKRVEGSSGQVRYFSLEAALGQAQFVPRLVLVYR